MNALLVSTALVVLGEMGDKTQLLALVLSVRYRRPAPIVAGILVATLANHALAGLVGNAIAGALGAESLRWLVGLSFVLMAGWMLIPDKPSVDDMATHPRFGVFATTVVAFFVAEMGDKTQIATVALAARFDDLVAVVAGTTLGMMLANAPVVWLGDAIARRVPMMVVHRVTALVFLALGLLTLLSVDSLW